MPGRPLPTVYAIACAAFWAGSLGVALEASAQDVVAAAAAFDRGLADMEAGRFETGCPLLAESYRIDPRPGALFTQAECEARWGKLASALAHYDEFLIVVDRLPPDQRPKHAERRHVAELQKEALSASVPRLTLTLPASAPATTTVTRDGVELGPALLGIELPIDPGEHVVTTQAPGREVHEQRLRIAAGQRTRLVLVVDTPVAPVTTARETSVPGANARAPSGVLPAPRDATPSARRVGAIAAIGIGAAGIVLGAVTGIMVLQKKGTVGDHCDGPACDQEGKDAADAGQSLALVSTLGFGIGAASVGIGVVLLVTEPKPSRPAPGEPRATGIVVRGVF